MVENDANANLNLPCQNVFIGISNHMLSKVWHEITYLFPNFNGSTVEVLEYISNFISRSIECMVTVRS